MNDIYNVPNNYYIVKYDDDSINYYVYDLDFNCVGKGTKKSFEGNANRILTQSEFKDILSKSKIKPDTLTNLRINNVIAEYDSHWNKNGDPELRPKYLYDPLNKRWINTQLREYTSQQREYVDKGFTGNTFTFGYYDYDDLLGKWVLYNSNGTKTDLELIKAKARNYLFLPQGKRGAMMQLFRALNSINGNSTNSEDYWKSHNYYYNNIHNMSDDDINDYFNKYGENIVKAANGTVKTQLATGAALGGSTTLPELANLLGGGNVVTYLTSEALPEYLWGNAYDTVIKNFASKKTYDELNSKGAVAGGVLGLLGLNGGFFLSTPDLNTDFSNLIHSKNLRESVKNGAHLVLDWPAQLSRFTGGKYGILDDIMPYGGLIDDGYSEFTGKDIFDKKLEK